MSSGMKKDILVGFYSDGHSSLSPHINSLSELGYKITLSVEPFTNEDKRFDLLIFDTALLDKKLEILLLACKLPYLLYSYLGHDQQYSPVNVLTHSVGLISENATFKEICVNIKLSLFWHRERTKNERRIKDLDEKFAGYHNTGTAVGLLMTMSGLDSETVLEKVKAVSRSKQRRIADVAQEIISISLKDIEEKEDFEAIELARWLMDNISIRGR